MFKACCFPCCDEKELPELDVNVSCDSTCCSTVKREKKAQEETKDDEKSQ